MPYWRHVRARSVRCGNQRGIMMHMVDEDVVPGWRFEVRERSAGVYAGSGVHVSGASVQAVGEDPEDLLERLHREAHALLEPKG